MAMIYRSEIDGLRALAIIPVILFHAGVPGFGGGFVGVDVFFVISGYLIASILLTDFSSREFSIVRFYERRVRRIIPALFFMSFVSVLVGYFLLDPTAQLSLGKSLIASLLFVSNIFFYRESGYFDSDSELKRLLHTWSLSVEEQFYLFFPLLVWTCFKIGVRWLHIALVGGILISLAAAQYASSRYPSASFYLLPTRTWELLLGALLACHLSGKTRQQSPRAHLYAVLGVVMIAMSVLVFDSRTPFPGFYALVPTLGTVGFILYATADNGVGKVLSTPALVYGGLISYSAYLWHQPILAYGRVVGGHLTTGPTIAALLVIALMSWLSWRYIERPFRGTSQVPAKKLVLLCTFSMVLLLCLAAFMVHRSQTALEPVQPVRSDHLQLVNKCFLLDHYVSTFDKQSCIEPRVEGRKRILLIGDSHAASLYPGLRKVLKDEGVDVSLMTAGHCLPFVTSFPDNDSLTATSRCAEINRQVAVAIRESPHDLILMSGHIFLWGFNKSTRWTYPGYYQDYLETIARISNSGKKLAVIGQLPIWSKGLPNVLAKELGWRNDVVTLPERSASGIDSNIFNADAVVEKSVVELGVPYLSVLKRVCDERGCNRFGLPVAERRPFAVDYGHLSLGGGLLVAQELKPQIIQMLTCENSVELNCKNIK